MAVELNIREVTVQQVNGHGFKSTDGDWLNASKFAKPGDVVMPSVGDRVLVSLDKSGFVRRIEPIAPIATQNALQTRTTPIAGQMTPEPSITQDDRGIVITRLAVLNTAVALLSSGGGATTLEEVLEVAARLEVWATR